MSDTRLEPLVPRRPTTRKSKIVTAEDAVRLIKDGDVIATTGVAGCVCAEEVLTAVEHAFLTSGKPRDLTLIMASQIGNGRRDGPRVGNNHLAYEGLLRRVIAGHWGLAPLLGELAHAEKIEGYVFPQGTIAQLFREMAGRKPGILTKVGIGTFIDPRRGGGKVNAKTQTDLIEVMQISGEEYLFYRAIHPTVGILRGTTADLDGNVSMEREALFMEVLPVATAVHNTGGIVIVQVERITDHHTIHPREVKIPGILVDCIVIAKPENHWQTGATPYSPAFASEVRVPAAAVVPMPMSDRKIIARRAAFEIRPNSLVNVGLGMPEGLSAVANEENVADLLTMTNELGGIGGLPQGSLDFGAVVNADALVEEPSIFDIYDGGALDCAYLGMAQVDWQGNVNVSKFGPKIIGVGGFVNISQNTKSLVFMGRFTAGKLDFSIGENALHVDQEAPVAKFVRNVDQVTFSGPHAAEKGQKVLYITERCVFRLAKEGLELIEIAPGVDLESDVLGRMEFKPIIRGALRLMDPRIFNAQPMGLREILLSVPLTQRLTYDVRSETFFLNLEGFAVRNAETVEEIEQIAEGMLARVGHKVSAIANYNNLEIYPHVMDDYVDMILRLRERFFEATCVYTTSAFLRMRLGDALSARGVAPHIAWNCHEALAELGTLKSIDHGEKVQRLTSVM